MRIKLAKPYREAVGILLLNSERKVFVGHRIDTKSEAWQMPQGGIDRNETPQEAMFRELWEETGLHADKVSVLHESDDWYHYDLPDHLANTLWRGRYRGQQQKWFALNFIGQDADINISTPKPEFSAWKWAESDSLSQFIVPFKRELYEAVLRDFSFLFK